MSKRLVALFGAGVIVLAACGAQTTPGPAATTAPAGTPAATPTATAIPLPDLTKTAYKPTPVTATSADPAILAEWQTIDTINPYYASAETDIEAAFPSFLGMLNVTNDLKWVGFPNMSISDTVPLSTNGGVVVTGTAMDVTYKIHQGFKWSDGADITCADMEATWKWNMDPAQSGLVGGTIGWEDISSVEDKGGGTCVVHFKNVYEGYLTLFSPLLPKKYIESVPVKDAPTKLFPLTDIGSGVYSGPYIPDKYATNTQLEYKPNPNYWAATGKTPGFPKLIFKYYTDADAEKAGFNQSEYDVGLDLNHSDLPTLADKVECSGPQTPSGCNMVTENTFTYELFAFQNRSLAKKVPWRAGEYGDTDGPIIKQAVALATDKKEITSRALGGTVEPTGPNSTSKLFWWYKDEGGFTPADPTKAESMLEQAGWVKGSDGFRQKNGVTLELLYCTTTRPYRVDSLGLVAAQLARIGIKVDAKPVPANPDFFGSWNAVAADTPCNLLHGNYDVGMHAYVNPFEPLSGYNVYTCQGIPEDSTSHNGQNETRTCDPKLDAAWNVVKSTVDLGKIRDAMWTVQDYYASHTIEMPLFFWKNVYLVNQKFTNLTSNPTTEEILWNIDDWGTSS